MKHRIISLLVVLLLLCPAFAHAQVTVDGKDLKDLTYQELLDLQSVIEKAKEDKLAALGAFKLEPGKYVVGVEIPAGIYRCECKGAYSSAMLQVFEDETKTWPIVTEILAELYESPAIGKLELKDGYIVNVSMGAIDFMPYEPGE